MTDNATSQIGGIAADALRQFIERIERMNGEIKALNADKSDLFKQAKSQGFDVAVIREIIKIRAKDQAELDEFEQVLNLYCSAIGMNHALRVQVQE